MALAKSSFFQPLLFHRIELQKWAIHMTSSLFNDIGVFFWRFGFWSLLNSVINYWDYFSTGFSKFTKLGLLSFFSFFDFLFLSPTFKIIVLLELLDELECFLCSFLGFFLSIYVINTRTIYQMSLKRTFYYLHYIPFHCKILVN